MEFKSDINKITGKKNKYIVDLPNSIINIKNNSNIINKKILNEDVLIPIEVETYLNVNINY